MKEIEKDLTRSVDAREAAGLANRHSQVAKPGSLDVEADVVPAKGMAPQVVAPKTLHFACPGCGKITTLEDVHSLISGYKYVDETLPADLTGISLAGDIEQTCCGWRGKLEQGKFTATVPEESPQESH